MEKKRLWLEPTLTKANLVESTLGSGGTTCDGNSNGFQVGHGNDDNPPPNC